MFHWNVPDQNDSEVIIEYIFGEKPLKHTDGYVDLWEGQTWREQAHEARSDSGREWGAEWRFLLRGWGESGARKINGAGSLC